MNNNDSQISLVSQEWNASRLFEELALLSEIPASSIAAFELEKQNELPLLRFAKTFSEWRAGEDIRDHVFRNPNGARAFLATAYRLKSDPKHLGALVYRLYGENPQTVQAVEELNLSNTTPGRLARVAATGFFDLLPKD